MIDVKNSITAYAAGKNVLINAEAVQMLAEQGEFRAILDEALKHNPLVVSRKDIENVLVKKHLKIKLPDSLPEMQATKKQVRPILDSRFRILSTVENEEQTSTKIADFLEMFRENFQVRAAILKQRHALDAKPLSRLTRIEKGKQIDVIGTVFDKRPTKNGHVIIMLEDLEADAVILFPKDDRKMQDLVEHVLLDDVIAIKGVKGQEKMVIAKELLFPDLPQREQRRADRDVSLAILSDIHVGSKWFLEKEFLKFIEWINGRIGDEKEQEKVSKIKYIVIPGDNVDGIGVYPGQKAQLTIPDIYKQYARLAELLDMIPKHIEIFLLPGNHDAVRKAEPQPIIPEKYAPGLHAMENLHMLPNPVWIEIESLKIFAYHGNVLHEIFAHVPGMDYMKPALAIKEALIRRSLLLNYGGKMPFIPTKNNPLLFRELPDIYIGGDLHHTGYEFFKGTLIVNGATWQEQTEYEKKKGHIPTPGVVPVINLKTMEISETHFFKGESP